MTTYSHSRISTFEQCPYRYKLQYIDKIEPEIKNTIEAFMGSIVHKALEELYKAKQKGIIFTLAELTDIYETEWVKQYTPDILIVKNYLKQEDYFKMGNIFLINYYHKHKPFDKFEIIELETEDKLYLTDQHHWHIRIDKFCKDKEGNYYICDYKTNSRMKTKEEAESDRQLAMYSIWAKEKFPDSKSVKLIWHMLAFNEDVVSERTEQQLEKLKKEIVEKIKIIENTKHFPTRVSPLCNYCGFKNICPAFKS